MPRRRLKGSAGDKAYVMNVGLDLRLVDTDTLEVVDVISYQKQIIGREVQAGVFDILGTTIFDAGAGESALEPIQLAVRAVIERAVLEMMTRLYKMHPRDCYEAMESGDPLGDSSAQAAPSHAAPPVAAAPPCAAPGAGGNRGAHAACRASCRTHRASDAAGTAAERSGACSGASEPHTSLSTSGE